jgi:hypothetical protein
MTYETTGTIHQLPETVTFPSGFSKRLCVLSIQDGDYENFFAAEFLKDKTTLLDSFQVGQEVKITWNHPRSNENQKNPGNWFTNVAAWRIEATTNQQAAPPQGNEHKMNGQTLPQQEPQRQQPATGPGQETEDIPFFQLTTIDKY